MTYIGRRLAATASGDAALFNSILHIYKKNSYFMYL